MTSLLTIDDLIKRYGRDRAFYYHEIRAGRLRAANLGSGKTSLWRVLPEDAEAWLQAKMTIPPEQRERRGRKPKRPILTDKQYV